MRRSEITDRAQDERETKLGVEGKMTEDIQVSNTQPTRGELLHDLVVFQLKLTIDAVRDIILFPVTLVAGIIDFIVRRENYAGVFYSVLKLGRKSERWINLFDDADRSTPYGDIIDNLEVNAIDNQLEFIKRKIKSEYDKGTLNKAAKSAMDSAIDSVRSAKQEYFAKKSKS